LLGPSGFGLGMEGGGRTTRTWCSRVTICRSFRCTFDHVFTRVTCNTECQHAWRRTTTRCWVLAPSRSLQASRHCSSLEIYFPVSNLYAKFSGAYGHLTVSLHWGYSRLGLLLAWCRPLWLCHYWSW
jgi:hypothetical protein